MSHSTSARLCLRCFRKSPLRLEERTSSSTLKQSLGDGGEFQLPCGAVACFERNISIILMVEC